MFQSNVTMYFYAQIYEFIKILKQNHFLINAYDENSRE